MSIIALIVVRVPRNASILQVLRAFVSSLRLGSYGAFFYTAVPSCAFLSSSSSSSNRRELARLAPLRPRARATATPPSAPSPAPHRTPRRASLAARSPGCFIVAPAGSLPDSTTEWACGFTNPQRRRSSSTTPRFGAGMHGGEESPRAVEG
ncbi:hypothetical protein MSAN_01605600 [Mycena sanguinolenta]|uniref:Uncharacterized protein n=1 Tax=Mycena sanguinolenta TaxID=230812 RepID=A0A8H6Y4G3_9AGAR|nr:hypothetical protein MSAN_01605600 [Mycena sanguinolenta]